MENFRFFRKEYETGIYPTFRETNEKWGTYIVKTNEGDGTGLHSDLWIKDDELRAQKSLVIDDLFYYKGSKHAKLYENQKQSK